MTQPTVLVLAKSPTAGRVKTRLCPPCTPLQAAALAEAALHDTLAAVVCTPNVRRVAVLDGPPGPWLPSAFDVVPQVHGGLARRLAGAFRHVDGPALLIGMDTPQVTPDLLSGALERLGAPGVDAVLGGAADGGYWAIGFARRVRRAFDGVPMSTARTAIAQRRRLAALGLRWAELPQLRDVDVIADAHAVAATIPNSRFACRLRVIAGALPASPGTERASLAG